MTREMQTTNHYCDVSVIFLGATSPGTYTQSKLCFLDPVISATFAENAKIISHFEALLVLILSSFLRLQALDRSASCHGYS
jgi:hypothetical protein